MRKYRIVAISLLPGATSLCRAINDSGTILALSENQGDSVAFLWKQGKTTILRAATAASGNLVFPVSLNNRGDVLLGESRQKGPSIGYRETTGFYFRGGGSPIAIRAVQQKPRNPALIWGSHFNSWPTGLNDRGEIVGYRGTGLQYAIYQGSAAYQAFLWRDHHFNALSPALPVSAATAINNRGQVAGKRYCPPSNESGPRHVACLWEAASRENAPVLLGTLGGRHSEPTALNERGQIVGFSEITYENTSLRAFLWSNGKMQNLGELENSLAEGRRVSVASGINDAGEIVGYSETGDGQGQRENGTRAFLWSQGRMVNLNDLLIETNSEWVLLEARAINNRGQIVGTGLLNGKRTGFLLNPI